MHSARNPQPQASERGPSCRRVLPAQFTYFQHAGGRPLSHPAVEITYGLERILMSLQAPASPPLLPWPLPCLALGWIMPGVRVCVLRWFAGEELGLKVMFFCRTIRFTHRPPQQRPAVLHAPPLLATAWDGCI